MKIQSTLLAAAAVLTLAAPAAALADPSWHGSDNDRGYGNDQQYGYGQTYGHGRHDDWRRMHCRHGVFYMRGNACSNDYGRAHYGWRSHDHRYDDNGFDHRRGR